MGVNFPNNEVAYYEQQMSFGSEALKIFESPEWAWIQKNLHGALEEQAVLILKNARNEEERMKAQQMFIASHAPKEILERLVNEGKAAKIALQEISNLKEGE